MSLEILERSPYGTPLLVRVDRFHFRKREDSVFYQCTAPQCKFRLLLMELESSFTPDFLEDSEHSHDFQFSITIHLEYGKTLVTRLWYFNQPEEVVFPQLMKKFLTRTIAPLIRHDSERVCCSLFKIVADGKRTTVEVATTRPVDGDEFVFFYRTTTAKREETSDTVVVFDRIVVQKKEEAHGEAMSQSSNSDATKRADQVFSSEHNQTTPEEPPPSPDSTPATLMLNYGTPAPSESGELSISDLYDYVRVMFPIAAKLISACLDSRERLLSRLREIAVLNRTDRIIGTLLIQSSDHIVRQTVTLEKMTLCSSNEEFYVPKNLCNATICRCKHHPYPLRPCPELFHFNYCKQCRRARKFHFYVKNCSGIPLEHIKLKAILLATKVDTFWKMENELGEIFKRFAFFLAEGNSDSHEERLSKKEVIEKDVRKLRTYSQGYGSPLSYGKGYGHPWYNGFSGKSLWGYGPHGFGHGYGFPAYGGYGHGYGYGGHALPAYGGYGYGHGF
ncbi:hypothetical protein QR680_007471 [Steinernema hermaphroditum]|uniref:Uncharacterized protein n=1 Tax=Steinernema hermaphroditum TaxID=289476 RepID=A0AA39IFQ7_9BILA|nr:hypothetical protein QR680_007471 [Steinernema hermaphroditum]